LVDGHQLLVQQLLPGVKMLLPCLRRSPLRDRHPLEQGGPQLEALKLIVKVPVFPS
jgi:hypothetical protein